MRPITELRAIMDVLGKWEQWPPNVVTPADKVHWLMSLLRVTLKRLQREENDGKPFRWAGETVVESLPAEK